MPGKEEFGAHISHERGHTTLQKAKGSTEVVQEAEDRQRQGESLGQGLYLQFLQERQGSTKSTA